MAQRSAIAAVPGSFHRDKCLLPLVQALQKRGIDARTAALESSGKADATLADDVSWLRDHLLLPLVNEGKEVVLLLHSFSGGPGSAAARGLTLPERREQGLEGGVSGIICLAAFVLVEGVSSNKFLEGKGEPPSWRGWDAERGLFFCKTPRDTFYADVEDGTLAEELANSVVGHSPLLFDAPTPSTALYDSFFDGRRAYIRTLEDRALPLGLQDALIEESCLPWIKRDMSCGHSPFASHPEELADVILDIDAVFQRAQTSQSSGQ